MPDRTCFQIRCSAPRMTADSDEAELMLYGEIVPDYGKWYKENYPNDKSAADFDKAIKEIKESGKTHLLLRINSPGGIVTQAIAMRTILTAAAFEKVTVRIEGLCASAATFLAAYPGATVQMGEGSEYMIHNPWGGCWGGAETLENYAKRLRNIEQTSREFYAQRTGQSDEQIKKWMDAETWFTAKEALEYGFADEILEAKQDDEMPMVACVSDETMAVMHGLYQAVPKQIAVQKAQQPSEEAEEPAPPESVSNGTPVAGAPTEIKNNEEEQQQMDLNNLTAEQLQAQNPALFDQMRQSAIEAERQRVEDIDALTLPGYEAMAADAKKDGTSALDFQKQIVAAQKKKGTDFLKQRKEETKPAENVAGAAATSGKTEEQEIADNAKDIAEYAKQYASNASATMY